MNTHLQDELDKFLLWWWNGLIEIVPKSWRERKKQVKQYLVVSEQATQLNFRYYNDGREVSNAECPISTDDPRSLNRVREWLRKLPKLNSLPLILRLPASKVLVKRLRYPKSVEENLHNVLGFDIDRQTPFAREDVHFTCDVIEQADDNIDVDLLLVPKRDLKALDAALEEFDLTASVIDVDNRTYFERQVNLLPTISDSHSKRPTYRTRFALFILWMILLTLIPLKQRHDTTDALAEVEAKEANSRAAIVELNDLRDEHARLIGKKDYFRQVEAAHIPATELLYEVTHLLGDGTWIRRFDMKNGKLTLQGESDNASEIPGTLEGSKYFSAPRFSSPVTRNNATGKDRFQLVADIGEGDAT